MAAANGWETLLASLRAADPEFAAAFAAFAGVARENALSPRVRALILFGLNISISHMNAPAAREAAVAARDSGATRDELREVAQLAVMLGIHSVVLVAGFVADQANTGEADRAELDKRAEVKARYLASRGFMPAPIERFLEVDAEFVDAYRRLSEIPFRRKTLPVKEAELIVTALDASVNHLYEAGCRAHISAALKAGASIAEVAEAIELAASVAGQATALGFAVADEVFGD